MPEQERTSPQDVAVAVDAAVRAVPSVVRAYRAAPGVGGKVAPSEVLAHVTPFPSRRVVVSIGVGEATASRDVAAAVAAAVRAALPADWADAAVRVQVRRLEEGVEGS